MVSNVNIGCHVSIAKSFDLSFDRAKKLGCTTFQVFTKNPRGWSFKTLSDEEIKKFKHKQKVYEIYPVVAHISYLPNLASQDSDMLSKSIDCFNREIKRCKILGIPYFVIHSGSYKGGNFQDGFNTYVKTIQEGLDFGENKVNILVENSAGGDTALTGTFSNIKRILDEINDQHLGVCFDTCHAFTAGYDISTKVGVSNFIEEVKSTIGMDQLKIVHANDSKTAVGSRRDLHQHIGLGMIGELGFSELINDPFLRKKPWILETPIDELRNDIENINYLHSLVRNEK